MGSKMKLFLLRWVVNTAAVLVAASIIPGIRYDEWTALLVATLVLGILNAVLRPLLVFLALPLVVVTLGLFLLVINALLLFWVGNLVKGFHVDSFKAAFLGSLVIFVVSLVLNSLTGLNEAKISVRRGGPPPPNRRDDGGGGPVIDV